MIQLRAVVVMNLYPIQMVDAGFAIWNVFQVFDGKPIKPGLFVGRIEGLLNPTDDSIQKVGKKVRH
jgi:hypothetical protein